MKACPLPPPKARLTTLPDDLVGCRFAVHGNSTARYAKKRPKPGEIGRTALSFHRVVTSGKTAGSQTLFNLYAPAVFKNARLFINQGRAKASEQKLQMIGWPGPRGCDTDDDCVKDRREVCCKTTSNGVCGKPVPNEDKPKKGGRCASVRRVKTPFAYVEGDVYPDDGKVRAKSISLFPGAWKDGAWIDAKYVDVTCPDFKTNLAACPAVTEASTVRFVPNFADGKSALPFSTSLEGRRRRRRR